MPVKKVSENSCTCRLSFMRMKIFGSTPSSAIAYNTTPKSLQKFRQELAAQAAAILHGSKNATNRSFTKIWIAILLLCYVFKSLTALPVLSELLETSDFDEPILVVIPFTIIFMIGLGVCFLVFRRRN